MGEKLSQERKQKNALVVIDTVTRKLECAKINGLGE